MKQHKLMRVLWMLKLFKIWLVLMKINMHGVNIEG